MPASTPIGIVKLSYFNGFYAIGTTDGTFETGTTRTGPTAAGERPISIPAWRVRLADAGDPYDGPTGRLRLGLFGNHWRVPAAHRLRVDLAQLDEPTFRRGNPPAALSFSSAKLVLPVR